MDSTGGLLTLSRWPIGRTVFEPSRRLPGIRPDERLARKGWLWTEILTPGGTLWAANVHLYAGNTSFDGRIRTIQTRQLVRTAPVPKDVPVLLAGDFNMAREHERAERKRTGFDVLHEAGFIEMLDGKSDGLKTMAPSINPHARYMPSHRPDRRLTQMFFRGPGLSPGPDHPQLCLHDPPVSDHFGLVATFRLRSK